MIKPSGNMRDHRPVVNGRGSSRMEPGLKGADDNIRSFLEAIDDGFASPWSRVGGRHATFPGSEEPSLASSWPADPWNGKTAA